MIHYQSMQFSTIQELMLYLDETVFYGRTHVYDAFCGM
ncbi:hypothetical protein NVP1152O_103 [Vibrio phage 1.152.O._10N.222.46.E1]|uniref:Uncharacterized protein n=5 Tax=Nahantvirus 49C7 TaxID=2846601 RepID=A0A2I7RBK0_9CAUD|nr:hypothetical protein HYP57_gp083 [Vibrio phage 1.026.O._10N.222.49.C7]AUR82585.1 hypothetical protein NVP1025O_102 [Vibrio phage 1.025.O._10N.222.46.B6]AUR90835.1 hypothetical protein NVP1150O_102 [Vibrio phage 1.150.O._10N.222.46.A6]AUR91008.1 hypothetical protein NVP1152O_103 [Vibrio phage 1.152.O._10N.222.46.E1]AUS02476.1 hypothetical protein NVP2130O_102 [Vibrio phage 2.130.O._10N.222.46.C2]AUR82693.1 hypothetical protein NVP1026O_102 [Vibrio phage 1.026.O._10N.222.49.C7]